LIALRHSLVVLFLLFPFALLGQDPEPAPGLRIPAGSLPYALDHFQGKPQLVPVHHSNIELNNHRGANVAGSLAGSFLYKPKITFEVAGEHARTILHDAQPSFYVHVLEDPDSGPNDGPVFAIVSAMPGKDRRVFAQIRFTQLTGNAKRNDGSVDLTVEHPPGGWLKITPQSPLPPGEYALTPIPKAQNAFSTVVFDFAIDPTAANDADAVQPEDTN
jgi:hypothetical protein